MDTGNIDSFIPKEFGLCKLKMEFLVNMVCKNQYVVEMNSRELESKSLEDIIVNVKNQCNFFLNNNTIDRSFPNNSKDILISEGQSTPRGSTMDVMFGWNSDSQKELIMRFHVGEAYRISYHIAYKSMSYISILTPFQSPKSLIGDMWKSLGLYFSDEDKKEIESIFSYENNNVDIETMDVDSKEDEHDDI